MSGRASRSNESGRVVVSEEGWGQEWTDMRVLNMMALAPCERSEVLARVLPSALRGSP